MSWIEGYSPQWVLKKQEALETVSRFGERWIGRTIEETYVGWYSKDDSWYADLPVILVIGGEQFDVCWQKFDSLSITNGQLSKYCCKSYGEEFPYRKDALVELSCSVGKKIEAVELGMSSMTLDGELIPMINSLDFYLVGGFLSIFNALDENGVTNVRRNT